MITALHSAAAQTLIFLNQSVDTTITIGTPQINNENDDPMDSAVTSTTSDSLKPVTSEPKSRSSSENSEPQTLFSHHRRKGRAGSLTTATTTISQTFEPASPPKPVSLIHALSLGEAEGPHDKTRALEELGPPPHARGLLLLAEMSSQGNLMTKEYTQACVKAARENKQFLHGIKSDGKGQQWRAPQEVIGRDGIDVVIVGRGIVGIIDTAKEAERYRQAAWEAYEQRIGRK